MAGYSGTPLAKKLGIKPGHRLLFLGEPASFHEDLQPLPDDVAQKRYLRAKGPFDVIVIFSHQQSELTKKFDRARQKLETAGGLWVAWPKKASKVATDLSFDVVQGIGLDSGLVDNKICAVDEVYSGLRFVARKKDR